MVEPRLSTTNPLGLPYLWEVKMPIYEYFCPHCNLKFELLRSLSQSSEIASCPRCHNSVKRMFSSFASPSKSDEEISASIGGSSPCSTCSATSCATCKG